MHAMVLKKQAPLAWTELPDRLPGPNEIRVKIAACGVCRTDLHVVDGELGACALPIIPGHEIVGRIDAIGAGVTGLRVGERVGIPWLGHTDGTCPYCRSQRENLCDHPDSPVLRATAAMRPPRSPTHASRFRSARRQRHLARAAAVRRPDRLAFAHHRRRRPQARTLRLRRRGAHLGAGRPMAGAIRVCVHATRRCAHAKVRARAGRDMGGRFGRTSARASRRRNHFCAGRRFGAARAAAVRKGGRVVCGGIHMSDIPSFPYELAWGERELKSVANLTRRGRPRFPALAPQSASTSRPRAIRCSKPIRRSRTCAPDASRAPPCSRRERRLRPHVGIDRPLAVSGIIDGECDMRTPRSAGDGYGGRHSAGAVRVSCLCSRRLHAGRRRSIFVGGLSDWDAVAAGSPVAHHTWQVTTWPARGDGLVHEFRRPCQFRGLPVWMRTGCRTGFPLGGGAAARRSSPNRYSPANPRPRVHAYRAPIVPAAPLLSPDVKFVD
jgi:alcohol dehydrogenase, propanol-preferring